MDATDITIVLDRSGSMQSVKADTIGGFNEFLKEQKAVPGVALFSLVQFNHEYEIVHSGKPLADVPDLTDKTYVPRGFTALLDAVGRAIVTAGERLAAMSEADRPDKVLLVIMTDGAENASKEFKREQIFEMISHQREKYKWQVVFIGANQDAISTGAAMGIPQASTMNYAATPQGTKQMFRAASAGTQSYRSSSDKPTDNFFTPDPAKP